MTTALELLPQLAQETDIAFIEENGVILFTGEEVGRQLGYANPRIAINKLFNQNRNELKHYSSVTATDTEAGSRETRVFTEEGVYILSMLARTNEAKRFRAKVALLLRRIREGQLARALAQGRREGAQAARSLSPFQERSLEAVLRYKKAGLTNQEAAKLLDCCRDTVGNALRAYRNLGLEV